MSSRVRFEVGATGLANSGIMPLMKYWELIADKLRRRRMVVGLLQRPREEGLRYIVHSNELLTAFLELEQTLV